MDALLEEVELGLADSQQAIHLEEALTGIIEGFEADGFEGEVLRMAAKQVEGLFLGDLGVLVDSS